MLMVLIGLGTWQIYRLRWKQGILAQIARPKARRPYRSDRPRPLHKGIRDRPLPRSTSPRNTAPTSGTPGPDPTIGSPPDRAAGTPRRAGDPGQPRLDSARPRETALADPPGEVTVTGYVRPGDTSHWFSAADDAAGRQFFTLDPAAIARALGEADVAAVRPRCAGSGAGECLSGPGRPPAATAE